MIKDKATIWATMQLLHEHKEGLSFSSIAEMMKRGKGFKLIKSRNTVSKALKELMKEGYVTRDIDTRKYVITDEGEKMLQKWVIEDEILSCQWFNLIQAVDWTDWKKTSGLPLYEKMVSCSGWLINCEKDGSANAVVPAIEKIRESWGVYSDDPRYKLSNWLPAIIRCVKEYGEALGIKQQGSLEEVWAGLFKGVKRIIVVETLNPSILLEKLKTMGINELEDLPMLPEKMKQTSDVQKQREQGVV